MLKTSSTDVNAVSSNLLLQQVGIQLKEFSEEYLKHETNQLRKAEMEGSLEALIEIIAEHTATNLKEAPEPVKEKTTGNVVQLFQR